MNKQNSEKMKTAIGLSGGVDSAVAAKILKDQGHQVVGLFLKLWSDPTCEIVGENRCCDYEALEDARRVAAKLDIPFYVVDAKQEFKKEVVDYFIEEYKHLRTPNPCVVCNEKIKFDLLLKKALSIGCEKLATGHYARISKKSCVRSKIKNQRSKNRSELRATCYSLLAGVDESKDQGYMLYRLNQWQLEHVVFPLGEMNKREVRALAVEWDLPVKEKAESQEICFFGDSDYRDFLRRYLSERYFVPGEIVDAVGNVVGHHNGLINYTIGQRKNVDQSEKIKDQNDNEKLKNKQPLYVIGFKPKDNQLIVGEGGEVYAKEMIVSELSWIDPEFRIGDADNVSVKIRYKAKKVGCKLIQENYLKVIFDSSQRAVTPGQSAVFYIGDEVIGGGTIV